LAADGDSDVGLIFTKITRIRHMADVDNGLTGRKDIGGAA
jgi:hypothetical protein